MLPLHPGQPLDRLKRSRDSAPDPMPMRNLAVFGVCLAAALAFPAGASTRLSYDAARRLLATTHTVAETPPPAWAAARGPLRRPRAGEDTTEVARKQFQQEQF